MGLLSEGKPLSWAETKKHADLVRRVGIQQFLSLYHRLQNRKDVLKWGDEVELLVSCLALEINIKVEVQEGTNLELRDRKGACVFHPILLAEIRKQCISKCGTSIGQILSSPARETHFTRWN